jgi:hypothetical protein
VLQEDLLQGAGQVPVVDLVEALCLERSGHVNNAGCQVCVGVKMELVSVRDGQHLCVC